METEKMKNKDTKRQKLKVANIVAVDNGENKMKQALLRASLKMEPGEH